jgi:AAA domain
MMRRTIKTLGDVQREHELDAMLTTARAERTADQLREDFAAESVPATSYARVEPVPQEWIWPGLIPAGRVTLVAGPSGTRKGFWATDLIARISRGDVMGDYSPGPPQGSVIAVTLEDDPNTAMAWRLRAARAELGRVHDLTAPGGVPFLLPDNCDDLSALCAELGDVRMIYIDPLNAATSVALGSNVTVRRRIINPLEAVAADSGAAMVVMHHTTKDGRTISGSKGLVDAARSVLRIRVDPARPNVRILELDKSNLAGGMEPIRFTTTGEWPDIAVKYLPATGGDDAAGAILSVLRSSGPMTAQEIAARIAMPCKQVMIVLMKLSREGRVHGAEQRGKYAATAA